jgi:hypothetical protein
VRASAAALAAALAAGLWSACSRGGDAGRDPAAAARPVPSAFDWDRPAAALDLAPEDVAARLGSFEWTASVEWTIERQGKDERRVRVVERHRVRQAATGEFEAQADVDPGLGPGSEAGKAIVWTGGTTYARARYAPWRERPTDRGRDARRFRDESFLVARDVARLVGPGLELRAAGDGEPLLRRPARRWALSLSRAAAQGSARARPGDPAPDDDTRRRRAFLDGLRARTASGEVALDAATGAPLRVLISATFAVEGDPAARATVEVVAQVKALGGDVAAVAAPRGALPDERKAAGVAKALEAAGLKKPGEEKGRAEPDEEE